MQSDRPPRRTGTPCRRPGVPIRHELREPGGQVPAPGGGDRRARRGGVDVPSRSDGVEGGERRVARRVARLGERRCSPPGAADRLADGDLVELVIALNTRAPGAARDFVVLCLEQAGRRVLALDSAQLVVSELVTNSFRRCGGAEVVVSVEFGARLVPCRCSRFRLGCRHRRTTCRPGHRGQVRAQSRTDAQRAAAASSGTPEWAPRISAQLPRAPRLIVAPEHRLTQLRALVDRLRAPTCLDTTGLDVAGSSIAVGRRRDG